MHSFSFADPVILIYAPNGMMKSSFTKVFECVANNDKNDLPRDRVYPNKHSVYEINYDGVAIDPETIFIANGETERNTDKAISTFLASKELKDEYDSIHRALLTAKTDFIRKLKDISQSTDCEKEFISTFRSDAKDNFYDALAHSQVHTGEFPLYTFKYNIVFDTDGKVKNFLEKHKSLIKDYFNNYNTLLNQSEFFNQDGKGASFGTYQAAQLSASIADGAFFGAKHKIVLKSTDEITTPGQLQEVIESEIASILQDSSLKKNFDKIDKALSRNADLRLFKELIQTDNSLIAELFDFDEFKKNVWLGYLNQLKEDVKEVLAAYKKQIQRLSEIIAKASEESSEWVKVVALFNLRFHVPFTVKITNKEDVILKETTPNFEFEFKDPSTKNSSKQQKGALMNILSNGERRAMFILELLFEIEARKRLPGTHLLILDDIAESFDYKNKYAIVEYIKDIKNSNKINIIILTHNFDFYRTIASRLHLGKNVYMVSRNELDELQLVPGQYRKNIFEYFKKKINNPAIFIACIPFVRNIIEYSKGESDNDYITLTNCLHIKCDTRSLTTHNIRDLFKRHISHSQINIKNQSIIDFIYETAASLKTKSAMDEILIENKLVLSIACRLKAEEFMLSKCPILLQKNITSNQTSDFFKEYSQQYSNEIENIEILEKVNLMTPENIHMNSFMYEPLIDLSIHHLVKLYKDLENLTTI